MQKLEKYKTQKLSQFSQLVILSDAGSIIESCDSIFSTTELKARTQPFIYDFPFLESIYDLLLGLKVNGDELKYSKIESPLEQLPGVYDFTFSRVLLDGREYILWSIFDYTDLYEDFKQYQQKRNELEIHRETLETRNRNLHHQKDLLTQKNMALQNWDEVRKDYYDKVRMALQSPVNALDGLSFILSNVSKGANKDYISALRSAVRHLQDVLTEFEIVSAIDGKNQFSEIIAFDLRQTIQNTTQSFLKSISAQNFQLDIDIADNLPTKVLGTPKHLQQILHQLLLNAQKFNPISGLQLSIDALKMEEDNWKISFGILEQAANDLLTNGDQSSKDATELIFRLSLVKKLIELEGGTIRVEQRTEENGFYILCQMRYLQVD